ncbi:unnamed protein product, partial [Trichogramma brassicae]
LHGESPKMYMGAVPYELNGNLCRMRRFFPSCNGICSDNAKSARKEIALRKSLPRSILTWFTERTTRVVIVFKNYDYYLKKVISESGSLPRVQGSE